jgi:hypothetical protein
LNEKDAKHHSAHQISPFTVPHSIDTKMSTPTTPTLDEPTLAIDETTQASETTLTSTTDQLNKDWKAMRELSKTPGHLHNTLCPFWQPGDTNEPRPECSNVTYTLFSINAFTKEGRAHKKLLDERDQRLKEAKEAKEEARWA